MRQQSNRARRHEPKTITARSRGRAVLWVECSVDEGAAVRQRARAAGLTISNYLRRCINAVLLEEGDDSPLLEERSPGRPGARSAAN